MRIVLASRATLGHHIGGMETYVDNQFDELRSLGHEVVLLTSPGVSQDYLRRLSAVGIPVDYIARSASLRYSADWHSQIQGAVDGLNPDIVIFHGVAGCSYIPTGRTSAITLTHGSAPISICNSMRGKRPIRSIASRALSFLRYRESFNLRRHQLVALSEYDARLTALATFQSRANITVIPPAIVLGQSDCTREKIVIYAGRIEAVKGVELILRIWRQVNSNGYKLVIVGNGSQLERLRAEYEDSNRVTFLGAISRAQLGCLLEKARWSVSGGRFVESFGLSVAESLASGTPVIYPRRGALPETAGAAGISYSSEKELRAALQSAVDLKEGGWDDLHRRARDRAVAFSSERSRYLWERLLSGVTGGVPRS